MKDPDSLKVFKRVAIVHYWLLGMRGGERVLEALLDLFPQAVIITHAVNKSVVSEKILRHEIRETFISRLPGARRNCQKYLPLMPLALELIDLQEFDLVISSESGPAKGVVPRPDALHVCYCHSPMRYIWDHYHIYNQSAGLLTRACMPIIAHHLRIWDSSSSLRVDKFIANSNFVRKRIQKYYRRDAAVIYPPIPTDEFSFADAVSDYYLLAGELTQYKRPDLAVDAFTKSGRKLIVVGEGGVRKQLETRAGPSIEFVGRVPFATLKDLFAGCRALVFPGEEDFGMIPVEVMASGKPVIAYGGGGALDTVVDGITGLTFSEQGEESLNHAVDRFESEIEGRLNKEDIRKFAMRFDVSVFKAQIAEAILDARSKI